MKGVAGEVERGELGVGVLGEPRLNHRPVVAGGLLAADSAELLANFQTSGAVLGGWLTAGLLLDGAQLALASRSGLRAIAEPVANLLYSCRVTDRTDGGPMGARNYEGYSRMRGLIAMNPRHLLAVLAAISALLVPAAVAWACNPSPSMKTDKLSYTPGEQMTVSGRYFSTRGNPTVTITTDPAGASATGVPVTSAGTFQTTLDAPEQPGLYTLVATSSDTTPAARTAFEVNTPPPTVPPPPAPGKCANDKLGTAGSDNLRGTNFGDRIFAFGGNDVVNAYAADDCIDGGSGSDRLLGFAGNDRVFGGSGNDRVSGGAGRDLVAGGSGRDVLTGDSGDDQLYGEGGNDTIYAGTGRTRIDAGTESDSVSARNGRADTINCGRGSDTARVDPFDRVAGCEWVSRG